MTRRLFRLLRLLLLALFVLGLVAVCAAATHLTSPPALEPDAVTWLL